MQLYNTLTKQKDVFVPSDKKAARLYSCGPTVYDHIHIGNLRAFITADTLRRVIEQSYPVTHVMNFTDVDDKTIKRSRESYPELDSHEALKKLTRHFETVFLSDISQVGCGTENISFVRATEQIPQMQRLISELVTEQIAYITDDGVYFSIDAYKQAGKKYGQLSNVDSDNTSQSRILNDEYDKDSVHDFALWKTVKDNEPAWDFEINGRNLLGRPGWHIECSAMSEAALGKPFDIHTGGIDLLFPHHENEIAQSTATSESPYYAKFFVHNEHLLVEGKKMSKSSHNFFTLRDIEERGFDPLGYRLVCLQSHYKSQLNFSWESMEAAQKRLQSLRDMADLKWQITDDLKDNHTIDLEQGWSRILEYLENDLNLPMALAFISTDIQEHINELSPLATSQKEEFQLFLTRLDTVFGLNLSNRPDLTDHQKSILEQREQARAAKDWNTSDHLRDGLHREGVIVKDSPTGQMWSRASE